MLCARNHEEYVYAAVGSAMTSVFLNPRLAACIFLPAPRQLYKANRRYARLAVKPEENGFIVQETNVVLEHVAGTAERNESGPERRITLYCWLL